MKVKKTIIAGLMSMATLVPCKAQTSFVSETGISGVINKEASFYTGINFQSIKNKNFSDLYAGISVQPDKKASFVGLAINNYSWTKNLSSWARETFVTSNRATSSTLEVAPIRANADIGKFNFSLAPSYTMYNHLRGSDKGTKQGINTILQATYPISPKETLFAEAKYTSEPAKNVFNTHFGKIKNNIAYMISYLRNF